MRILVTGANGLVGSRACKLLVEQGHEVVGLGRGERRATGSWRYLSCELTREPEVSAAFADASPEVVLHCASMTEVDACEREPEWAFAANVEATAFVARACRRAGAHLVHVSTDYVFDGEAGPYDEEALPNPRGVYALTKHMGEQAARVLAPGCAIARTAVVYGWPPVAGRLNFGAWLVGALEKGQPVRLFEDQIVSPSYAENVAAMVAELGLRRLGGVWNTCGAEVVDRVQFGRAVCEVFGFDPGLLVPVKMAELKLPAPRPLRSGLRTDKARRELHARPLALAESLARFHADCRRAGA
ncbi:SDR family oxidoreductase [Vitiosangium sp. GDMCC 1.1324]|uniref:SDR family oxidoreductase n=1 Tax=Vitiosangium sp. (strain GDMCC 1.1324) TaxID=2138576 RepID=UPI000D369216|nr:SDR family oxidoreductase [Vitiosangium sp. GDMCC 1.1324]PTL76171.1 NAD(P)-dependent oxidoreductase [Vitiosangium sp. GDMCC 1.1324]